MSPYLSYAQGSVYKFPITTEGIYKITEAQARQMGASSVDEICVYGQQGMLSQKLDSSAFQLNQLQVKKIGKDLFFYASGPHFYQYEGGSFHYQHHPYTDTLYYLVESRGNIPQNKIGTIPKIHIESNTPNNQLYTFHTKKEEFHNILNSGRKWYGNRSFNGQRINLFFPPIKTSGAIYYSYRVMGQSLSGSEFTFQLNDKDAAKTLVSSISENTYGIKGREESNEGFFDLTLNTGTKASFLYTTGNPNGTGYLDYLTLGYPTNISSLEQGIYHRLDQSNGPLPENNNQYWAVGNRVFQLESGSALRGDIRKIAVFNPVSISAVSTLTQVDISLRNNLPSGELIIITPKALKSQADKLAAHRQKEGISAKAVLIEDVYNAYGYGNRDVTAIRNFVAHAYRSGQLKNLLLFGKGTYDYKFLAGGRPNLIPIYTSRGSLNPLATYSSDDYYGFLNWGEGEWDEDNSGDHLLSIGVGRIPVINLVEAANVVEKLIAYDHVPSNLGEWKRKVLLFADDGDNNLHLNDSEKHAALLHQRHPEFLIDKLYLDAFPQVISNDLQRSPTAEAELLAQVREGVLLINYVGHGNETTLTAERVFTTSQLADWPERNNLPVFVTATCEFGRHDSPFSRSGAEDMLTLRSKGAIALLTTGRPVFSSANFALNKAFIDQVFVKEEGVYPTLGEIYKNTKNNSNNGVLNRSFALLGDPSMKLALPDLEAHPDRLSELEVEIRIDTLKALQKISINGKISDPLTQSTISGFNGEYLLTISDKPGKLNTLGNQSQATTYLNENTIIFRGTGKIAKGEFTSEIFIPSNIQEQIGRGLIKVYAQSNDGKEALGAKAVLIGDKIQSSPIDTDGPIIRMMVADTINSTLKIQSTTIPFYAFLQDKSGINISTTTPYKELRLQINEDQEILLNRHYTALNGSFTNGRVHTTISGLKEGMNTLILTAFDNLGNRSVETLQVEVEGSLRLRITEHLSYPNPASEYSRFKWTHNRPGDNLSMKLRIFNIMGSEIFSYTQRFPNASAVLDEMEWIFLQAKTKYPAKGTYIYELVLQSEADGTSDRKSGKLLIQ